MVAIPALFIGLLLESVFRPLNDVYFYYLTRTYGWRDHNRELTFYIGVKERLIYQLHQRELNEHIISVHQLNRKQLSSVCASLLLRQYTSEKLFFFRSPKSFGILFFNSTLVMLAICFILFFSLFKIVPEPILNVSEEWQSVLLTIFIWIAAICFNFSRAFYTRSLKLELKFWSFLTWEELQSICDLVRLVYQFERNSNCLIYSNRH